MSRDLIILNVADEPSLAFEEMLQSARPLGSQEYVIRKIKEVFPEVDVSDPLWIIQAEVGYSLAFNLSGQDPVESLTINIHGKDDAIEDVKRFCLLTGWRAVDPLAGEFVHVDRTS